MKFLYPEFLYASAAIAIPIIIHLFNFRRYKRVLFTNVKFLKEVQQETKSKQRLKHLLVLAARIFAILLLVAAFAQPYIPVEEKEVKAGQKVVSIYIDNSYSMNAVGPEGELLEVAKNKAREILDAYQPSDKFQLITNDFSALGRRMMSKEDFIKRLAEVKLSPASRKMSEVINKQRTDLKKAGGVDQTSYLISDGQSSVIDFEELDTDSTIKTQFVKLPSNKRSNISVDSVWLEMPFIQLEQPAMVKVKLTNYGSQDLDAVPVNLKINGVQKALASVNLNAETSTDIELTFTINEPGWKSAEVSVLDNPIVFDDKFYFSFHVTPSLPILVIDKQESNTAISAIYELEDVFELTEVNSGQIDYSSFSKYNFIIINELQNYSTGLQQELKKYCENGGSLLIIPTAEETATFTELNAFLQQMGIPPFGKVKNQPVTVDKVDNEHRLFTGVFEKPTNLSNLLKVNKNYQVLPSGLTSQQVLIKLQDGNPFLAEYTTGLGNVYVLSSPLNEEWNNFTREAGALYVPLMMNMALFSSNVQYTFTTIGKGELIELASNIDLRNDINKLKKDDYEIIPEFISKDNRSFMSDNGEIVEAGGYSLIDEGNKVLQSVSYNYDRKESNTNYIDNDELLESASKKNINIIDGSTDNIARAAILSNQGIQLWWWCIILVLFFLAIEVFLLRFVK